METITFKADQELARRLREVEAKYRKEQAHAHWLKTASYDERLAAYKKTWRRGVLFGFERWYPKNIRPCYHSHLDLGGTHEYFHDGEELPCLMAGSILAMQSKYGYRYHMPTEVFSRYIRRIKLTCLTAEQYWEWLKEHAPLTHRISEKWGGKVREEVFAERFVARDGSVIEHTRQIHFSEGDVLLDGRLAKVDPERRELIGKLDVITKRMEALAKEEENHVRNRRTHQQPIRRERPGRSAPGNRADLGRAAARDR